MARTYDTMNLLTAHTVEKCTNSKSTAMTQEQKAKVDQVLERCAKLFCNLGSDSDREEYQAAKRKEAEILEELKEIAPEEYQFYKETRDA